MKRRILLSIILLVLSGIVLWSLLGRKSGPELMTVEVKLGSIEEAVTAQGKIEPKDYVDVGA